MVQKSNKTSHQYPRQWNMILKGFK
jgi:hypothetical protein